MQKIDDCKGIRLALIRAGIATRPETCLQTFRLVVTAQYIYHTFSLGLPYRSGEPLSPVGGTKKGKLLTNKTTVFVDITITTTMVRAAEHLMTANCRNTPLLTGVTSAKDGSTSFV
jgi:hypothetical protein